MTGVEQGSPPTAVARRSVGREPRHEYGINLGSERTLAWRTRSGLNIPTQKARQRIGGPAAGGGGLAPPTPALDQMPQQR